MKRYLLTVLGVISLCLPAFADEWYVAYQDDEVTVYFYDEIKKTSDGYRVWIEYDFNKSKTLGKNKYYKAIKFYKEYNKEFDEDRTYVTVWYNSAWKTVDSHESSYPSWHYLIPGSIGYEVAYTIQDYINYISNN